MMIMKISDNVAIIALMMTAAFTEPSPLWIDVAKVTKHNYIIIIIIIIIQHNLCNYDMSYAYLYVMYTYGFVNFSQNYIMLTVL